MIQRPGNCPQCGYWDPFHASWFSPDKEVADPKWAIEWDLEILSLCKEYPNGITIEHEDGDWWYHFTRGNHTLERYPISILKVGLSPAERVGKTWRQKRGMSNDSSMKEARLRADDETPSTVIQQKGLKKE